MISNVQNPAFNIIPLMRAVLGLPDDGLSCRECLAGLPAYVDAEVGGIAGRPDYRAIKRHLSLCLGCVDNYLQLLELALEEERGHLPKPAHDAEPDLSFLNGERSHA